MKKLNDHKMAKLLSNIFLSLLIFSISVPTYAEDTKIGTVLKNTNLREGPSTNSEIQGVLQKGCHVTILNDICYPWLYVSFEGIDGKKNKVSCKGYVSSELVSVRVIEDNSKYPRVEGLYGTEERTSIGCDNIIPSYDRSSSCSLVVNATNADYDTVFKLCRSYSNECIRMVYVRQGTKFEIKNIPTGTYYFKLASGTDMRKKVDSHGNCLIVFVHNESYTKTNRTFYFEQSYDGTYTAGEYTLQATRHQKDSESVSTRTISAEEFNR